MFSVIFPGQGSQIIGMGKEFFEKYDLVKKLFKEADDVLGILGTANPDTIIWSEDKDLLTVPAQHWLNDEVVTITEAEANYNFFYQTLVGKYFFPSQEI